MSDFYRLDCELHWIKDAYAGKIPGDYLNELRKLNGGRRIAHFDVTKWLSHEVLG
jgi:hypothetical protein